MKGWKKIISAAACFFQLTVYAQPEPAYGDDLAIDSTMGIIDTALVSRYPFIQYGLNKYSFFSDSSPSFERFYEKFDSLINYRNKQLVVYHIGGSHIQADIYSNRMRTYLNTFWPGLKGARGLVFPYTLAGTNNPWNYRIDSLGEWSGRRCVIKKDTSLFGLMGMSASTYDSIAGITIYYREKETMRYQHDRIKIYHNVADRSWKVTFGNPELVINTIEDTVAGFTQFILSRKVDTVKINIQRVLPDTSAFTTYGIELMNNEPGVVYNSIGVNGAAFPNYLRCEDFEKQLSQMKPDLFIISIGTNDANVLADEFDTASFYRNYEALIQKIYSVNPGTAILMTVPNDAYYYKRYPNKNVAKEREVIFALADKYNIAVWNFYDIMGGFGSSQQWYKNDLMHKDRIHFTYEGYNLKGDLFFEAFLKYLEEFEYRRLVRLTNKD
ncbi:MAG: GDSL-type esterase/lipase family protein [Bacteroidota bacterium]